MGSSCEEASLSTVTLFMPCLIKFKKSQNKYVEGNHRQRQTVEPTNFVQVTLLLWHVLLTISLISQVFPINMYPLAPAPDIWSWRLHHYFERYLPHVRKRKRLYWVFRLKHQKSIITRTSAFKFTFLNKPFIRCTRFIICFAFHLPNIVIFSHSLYDHFHMSNFNILALWPYTP